MIVDTVVTDKKGAYVQDLTQKNFRVFEDGKEMDVKTFSSEAEGAAAGKSQQRYIVLFFDNSTMDAADAVAGARRRPRSSSMPTPVQTV